MGVPWNTNDLYFDGQGRLVIKNLELSKAILEGMGPGQGLQIKIDDATLAALQSSLPSPGPTSPGPWPSPPDVICGCKIVGTPLLRP